MPTPKSAYQSVALRLIQDAATGRDDAADLARAAERVFLTLHEHLGNLIGVVGFRTLLVRSLKLARPGRPELDGVAVQPEGTIAGFGEAAAAQGSAAVLAASTALLAQFLDLLATFVGEDLALHLVREATQSALDARDQPEPAEDGSIDEGSSARR